jgi:hypothetical protein
MSKFRKKPIVIEAMEYTGNNGHDICQWSNDVVVESPVLEPTEDNPTGRYLQIKTLEGIMTAIVGDSVIRGIRGEFYPCKDEIFTMTYEPVEEGEPA